MNCVRRCFSATLLVLAAFASMDCARDCNPLDVSCNPYSALLLFSRQSTGKAFYVPNGGNAVISMYRIDPYAKTVADLGTVAAGGTVRGVAVDSARSIAYFTVISIPALLAFNINPETGALTQLRQNSMPSPNGNFLNISPSGGLLQAVGSTNIQPFTADSGTTTAVGSLIAGACTNCRRPASDPQGRYVYFPDSAAGTLRRQNANADGSMGTLLNTACSSQARAVTFARNGSIVHCFNPVTANIFSFRLEADGSLTQIGNYLPGIPGHGAGVYNRTESILYVLDVNANLIRPHAVEIGGTVTMTPVGTPVSVPATASDIYIEGSGQLLFVLSSASVTVFSIGTDQISLSQIAVFAPATPTDVGVYSPARF